MDIGQFLLPFWAYREAEKLITIQYTIPFPLNNKKRRSYYKPSCSLDIFISLFSFCISYLSYVSSGSITLNAQLFLNSFLNIILRPYYLIHYKQFLGCITLYRFLTLISQYLK